MEPLRARLADGMPAYGSCAGMILLASEIVDAGVPGREAVPLGGIDMTVRRNAFGRQVDSFEDDIDFTGLDSTVHAVFIRAPWVERVGAGRRGIGEGGRASRRGAAGPDARDVVSSRDDRRPPRAPTLRRLPLANPRDSWSISIADRWKYSTSHYGARTGSSRRDDERTVFRLLVPTLAWRKFMMAGVAGFWSSLASTNRMR